MKEYITAEVVKVWFNKHFRQGAPLNAEEIAPALNKVFNDKIDADPTDAYYRYAITGQLAFTDFMYDYLNGDYADVPRPVVIGAEYYLPEENEVPAIGTTLTGEDADIYMYNIGTVESATEQANDTIKLNKEQGYTGSLDFKVARWRITVNALNSDDPYTMTRIDDADTM